MIVKFHKFVHFFECHNGFVVISDYECKTLCSTSFFQKQTRYPQPVFRNDFHHIHKSDFYIKI